MDISLELYRVFVAVAETKSFSRASESLFVSQSAVSQSIKTLESRLGLSLFVRTTKKVELTSDASILLESLQEAFTTINTAELRIKSNRDPFKGELKIAATDTLCKYFLLDKINRLHKKYPEIKIKIINGTSLHCLELLEKAQIDFVVINIPESMPDKFKIEVSYPFQDVFVARNDFEISSPSTLSKISKQPLLVLDDKSVTRRFLNDLFLKKGIVIEPEIELQNIDILLEMAKIGLGISFVPDLCLQSRRLKIIETKENIPKRQYGIVSLEQIPLNAVAKTFLSTL